MEILLKMCAVCSATTALLYAIDLLGIAELHLVLILAPIWVPLLIFAIVLSLNGLIKAMYYK